MLLSDPGEDALVELAATEVLGLREGFTSCDDAGFLDDRELCDLGELDEDPNEL